MDAEDGDPRQLQFDNTKYNTTVVQSELDEKSAQEKAIDDSVPIAAPSRTVKWCRSTVHMVTIIVGTGVLGLPHIGWFDELGQHAFSKKLGFWIVLPQQLIGIIAVDIVYMVTGGAVPQKVA